MSSIGELLVGDDSAFSRVVVARLPRIRQALREEHEHLEALLPTLTSDTIDTHVDYPATAARLVEIEAEIEADIIEIRMQGIGRKAWRDLLAKHPPTREQKRDTPAAEFNPDTFPFEVIAASCASPTTADEVRALEAKTWFNEQCWSELWGACLRANVVDPSPKSLAASILLRSEASSKRRTTTASPAASSSAES